MKRRQFIKSLALSSAALISGSCSFRQRPPNIIFFLIDDLGWKDVGFMGSRFYETPNIDRLAGQGMVFTQAYANAPNCAPSRACILTGLYPPRHGIYTVNSPARGRSRDRRLIPVENKTVLDPKFQTIAEILRKHGYTTASMGKWHLGDDPLAGPQAQGFDINIGGSHYGHPPAGYFAPFELPGLEKADQGDYLTDRLTDEALAFINRNQRKPFFLYLPHYAVHTPIQARRDLLEKYRRKRTGSGQGNPEYAAMIESVDQGIGRITALLEKLDIDRETVIIFTSDNGGVKGITSMEPLRGGKGMLYEGGIRVPFFIRWPGQAPVPERFGDPVIGLDLFPTILDLAGIRQPAHQPADGLSLLPLLQGGTLPQRALYWHFPAYLEAGRFARGARDPKFRTRPAAAIRYGDWKLIEYFEDGYLELFNLRQDIGETHNLASAHPRKRDELRRMMRQWRARTRAPVPTEQNPDFEG